MADLTSFTEWIADSARVYAEQAEHLTDLDRAIGDGDHGSNMNRGFAKAADLAGAEEFAGVDAYLKKVGMTLVSTVGGASGPLYGTFFLRMAAAIGQNDQVDATALGSALRAGVEGVIARGRAEPEDKTMVDAWTPAVEAAGTAAMAGASVAEVLAAAANAANAGAAATEPLIARKGRASYLGERSAGHLDPGAVSSGLILQAAVDAAGAQE